MGLKIGLYFPYTFPLLVSSSSLLSMIMNSLYCMHLPFSSHPVQCPSRSTYLYRFHLPITLLTLRGLTSVGVLSRSLSLLRAFVSLYVPHLKSSLYHSSYYALVHTSIDDISSSLSILCACVLISTSISSFSSCL